MWQVNFRHPDNDTEITVAISNAVDEINAKAKALAVLAGNNPNDAEGYEATLVRKVSAVLFPEAGEVMYVG